jgi:Family of unknown function (DUF6171)
MIWIFLRFLKSYLISQWGKWRGYEVIASPKVMLRRNQICEGCDFWTEGICSRCGCPVIAKTVLSLERCPVNKWGRVWRKKNKPDTSAK